MRLILMCLCSFGVLAQGPALVDIGSSVQADGSVIENRGVATVLTFEGLTNVAPIGTIQDATFNGNWLALVDSDAGGSGDIANEPSGETVAFLDYGSTAVASDTRITFGMEMGEISFYYCLNSQVGTSNVYFYDSSGTLLGSVPLDVCGAVYCGNNCSGDPNGGYCAHILVSFSAPGIAYLEFDPVVSEFMTIDDFTYELAITVPTIQGHALLAFIVLLAGTAIWVARRRAT